MIKGRKIGEMNVKVISMKSEVREEGVSIGKCFRPERVTKEVVGEGEQK